MTKYIIKRKNFTISTKKNPKNVLFNEHIKCSECGEEMTYNPYQNFWGCINCESNKRGLFGLIEDIMNDNLNYNIQKWLKQRKKYYGGVGKHD